MQRTTTQGIDRPRSGLGTVAVTTLGGPTVVLDHGGLRLVVDPTFDPPGRYPIGNRALVKTAGPAWTPDQVGPIDAVLVSHDQHPDNLDDSGRTFLKTSPQVFTTTSAAERLGGTARGLEPWESVDLVRPGGGTLRVTATPAQHGPDGTEHLTGPVIGFVLSGEDLPSVYVSGDNASLEVVRAVAGGLGPIDVAVLFAGGAKTALLGDAHLTLSAAGAADAVRILGRPRTVVVHIDGWTHVTEPLAAVRAAFATARVARSLVPTRHGTTVRL